MTKTTRTILYSLLALLLATIPASLPAQPHGPGFGGHGPGWSGGGRLLERLADQLELSESQREQIRAAHEVYREDVEALSDLMGVARRDLQEQIQAGSFDETAIREASSRVAAVGADLAVLRARIHSDVRQILTPEQAAKADELRELFSDLAGERRGHLRRGPGGGFRGGFGPSPSEPESD
jgi:Spy/CpxP family protein refolding chaperone